MKAISGLLIIMAFGLLEGCANNTAQNTQAYQKANTLPTGSSDAATFAAKTY